MELNVKTIHYEAELITETGARIELAPAQISLSWEENVNELAARANLKLQQKTLEGGWLSGIAKLNCIIRIFSSWNGGARQLMYEGTIWDWHYTSATQKILRVTAYDGLIRLSRSREFYHYQPGMSTQALVSDIFGQWGIPLTYEWRSITHAQKSFRGRKSVADMAISLLEEVRDKTGEDYVILFSAGRVVIRGYGANSLVFELDRNATVSTSNRRTLNNLVTKVKVYGKEDSGGRRQVEGVVEGDTRFGVLQDIVLRDSNTSLAEAMSEANTLIANRGIPEPTIEWEGPDVPFLRKGDYVRLRAGDLIGLFAVEGVIHRADARSMSLTLSRR